MATAYKADQAVMTRDELRSHRVSTHGRDYDKSGDGWDDMENSTSEGWHTIPGWGRDGWDLGQWPYVVTSARNVGDKFQMQVVIEGDHEVYDFESLADREAAIDYLFIWYGMGQEYDGWVLEGLTLDKRDALDAGTLRVPDQFRGPFSWPRLGAETP